MLIVDLKQDKSKENKFLSNTLINSIEKVLNENQKIILYLNKRGDFSSLICTNCSFLFKCKNCDASMSIHDSNLVCHICGFQTKIPNACPSCGKNELYKAGIGTGQIEKFLKDKYKDKKIYRFDTDAIKSKKEKLKALEDINNSHIIIGTKMITTGFDIENIGLIGIVLLEQELQIPKYYTSEKVYSNLKQILGRGGRKGENTNFIIQTYIPENQLIKDILFSNYKSFFKNTLEERKLFNYPPFNDLVILDYRDKDKEKAKKYMSKLKNTIENNNSLSEVEIIENSSVFKKNNLYHCKIVIKGQRLDTVLDSIKKEIFSNSNLSLIYD